MSTTIHPSTSLTLYSSQDKDQDFWRPPICDSHIGGKSNVQVDFVEEEIDYRRFYVPKKQGEVDTLRGKPENETESEKEENGLSPIRTSRVLQLKGYLSTALPEKQPEQVTKIARLGFASIMAEPVWPPVNLSYFDAIEYRIRVMDNRVWVANVACKGDDDGEMFQSLFTGEPNEWTSVIIPFSKFLYTHRGEIVEHQQLMDSHRITSMGFLQAERQDGEFCLQLESIQALSLARMSKQVRYDPDRYIPNITDTYHGQPIQDVPAPEKVDYYPVIKY